MAVVANLPRGDRGRRRAPIAAIGITNQRETTVLWGSRHRPPGAQRDRLARPAHAELCESWHAAGLATLSRRDRPCHRPLFLRFEDSLLLDAAARLAERAYAGEILFGTIAAFVVAATGGRRTEPTLPSSRTMLFDLRRLAWDDELLRAFGIPRALLRRHATKRRRFRQHRSAILRHAIPIAGVGRRPAGGGDRAGVLRPAWSNRPLAPARSR